MKLHLKLKDDGIHYSLLKCLSYNAFLNICIGARGTGKTTACLSYALKRATKGKKFLYMRRYKAEIKEFVSMHSLDPICDDIDYKGTGNGSYVFQHDKHTLGVSDVLSNAIKMKSTSWEQFNTVIYDEAILPHGGMYRYLTEEMTVFLEMLSTIERVRAKGNEIRVFVLGNNADLFNPFFEYFNVPFFKERYFDPDRSLYCEVLPPSEKLLELEKDTGLYNLTKGTAYFDYHYGVGVLDNGKKGRIDDKPSNCKPLLKITIDDKTLQLSTFRAYKDIPFGLYAELKPPKKSIIIDYEFMKDNKINYLIVEQFRKKYRNLIGRFFYQDAMVFANEKSLGFFNYIMSMLKA